MKKLLLIVSGILLIGTVNGQIIFQEDFDFVGGPTSGGAGTYQFPAGWMLVNVDNRTPAASVAYVNDAWERREDFSFNVADSCAFSTSWYAPAGAADDWMWTPPINITPNCVFKWNAVTYDASYPDGYEIRIMVSPNVPTGTTGNLGNMVSASTQLFTIAAENTTWTARQLSLSAYTGQTVRIAFRNNSNDKFLLLIDDVVVEQQTNYDASVLMADTATEYTLIPLVETQPLDLTATVRNNGLQNVTNVRLKVDVMNSTNTLVYTSTSNAVPTLAPNATSVLTVPGFAPSVVDVYSIKYKVLINEADQIMGNDSMTVSNYVDITDSVYGRDDATVVGGLGIGAGNGGYVGQDFIIVNPAYVSSVSAYVTRGYTGRRCAIVIWDMVNGMPNSIIGGTDTILYPDDSARFYTLDIRNNAMMLNTGRYAVTMVEFPADSTIQLGQTNNRFTNNRGWVNWPTNPNGGWSNPEDFGSNFAKSYVIRPNFATCANSPIASDTSFVDASCGNCTDGNATATPVGGIGPYTYSWSNGQTTQTATGLMPGIYTVVITDAIGCSTTNTVAVSFPTSVTEELTAENLSVYPNPSNGNFFIELPNISNAVLEIVDALGKVVYTGRVVNNKIAISNLAQGVYSLRVITDGSTVQKQIIIN
jgi:hypothetical protein